MKNNEALFLLKFAIETYGFNNNSHFNKIVNSLKEFITELKILNEIDRNNIGETLLLIDEYFFETTNVGKYYFLSDLEKFDYKYCVALTIAEIKKILKLNLIKLNQQKDISGTNTEYYEHWEYERRLKVIIKKDLADKIKENKELLLEFEHEEIQANLGYYQKFTIEEYVEPEKEFHQYENYSSRERDEDYFNAMTDGQLGDFEDFNGDSDYIDTWANG